MDAQETHRTLKPGEKAVVTSWKEEPSKPAAEAIDWKIDRFSKKLTNRKFF